MGELARTIDLDLEFVDVGGGFGVPYHPDDPPLDLESVADATRDALGDIEATLVVEPGRYLVADAGVLLTRVNTVEGHAGDDPRRRRCRDDDARSTCALRLLSPHRTVAGSGDESAVEATVAGPICESSDTFGTHALADPTRGDLLAIGNAGAYGYEMASQYNSRPRPAVVAVDGDRIGVAHRRETLADVIATEEVPWE